MADLAAVGPRRAPNTLNNLGPRIDLPRTSTLGTRPPRLLDPFVPLFPDRFALLDCSTTHGIRLAACPSLLQQSKPFPLRPGEQGVPLASGKRGRGGKLEVEGGMRLDKLVDARLAGNELLVFFDKIAVQPLQSCRRPRVQEGSNGRARPEASRHGVEDPYDYARYHDQGNHPPKHLRDPRGLFIGIAERGPKAEADRRKSEHYAS
jgi:hypothetical protein